MFQTNVQTIPILDIKDDPREGGLRKYDNTNPEVVDLKENIKALGILNPPSVRWSNDGKCFFIVDGHQRIGCARDLFNEGGRNFEKIPVNVIDIPADDVPLAQIAANLIKVETKPVQYAKQLQRILAMERYRFMSREEIMASMGIAKVGKSATWFNNQLKLNDLAPEIAQMVDENIIGISNAYYLAKLPPGEQFQWMEAAKTMDTNDFQAKVANHLQEIRATKKGQSEESINPLDQARGRKLGDHKEKLSGLNADLNKTTDAVKQSFIKGAIWHALWSLQIDQETLDAKKAEKDAAKRAREDAASAQKEQIKKLQEEAKAMLAKGQTPQLIGA